jgi:hypothetical protein
VMIQWFEENWKRVAASGPPPHLAAGFTNFEMVVLSAVGGLCQETGACATHIDATADRAMLRALHKVLRKAHRRGLIKMRQEQQEVIVRIASAEWRMLLIGEKGLWPRSVPANLLDQFERAQSDREDVVETAAARLTAVADEHGMVAGQLLERTLYALEREQEASRKREDR